MKEIIHTFEELKNLNRHIGVVILFCLGVLLMPSQSYACSKKSTKTEQSSCSKEKEKDLKGEDCCKTRSCKKSKEDKGHCNGNCKDKTCTNNTPLPSIAIISYSDINKDYFVEIKKQRFGFKQIHYSSGYFSIWLPPKIS